MVSLIRTDGVPLYIVLAFAAAFITMRKSNWGSILSDPDWRRDRTDSIIDNVVSYLVLGFLGFLLILLWSTMKNILSGPLWLALIVGALCGTLIAGGAWFIGRTLRSTQSGESPAAPAQSVGGGETWLPPELPKNWDTVFAVVGTASIKLTGTNLKTSPFRFRANGNSIDPVKLEIRDNRIHVTAELGNEHGEKVIFKDGQILGLPPNWDKQPHSDNEATAFEVVDEKGRPRLQIYYRHPTHLVVNGLFIVGNQYVAAYDGGFSQGVISQNRFPFIDQKPLYKYPAFQFPNQLAEQRTLPAIEPRPLSDVRKDALALGLEILVLSDEWDKKRGLSREERDNAHEEMKSVYRARFQNRALKLQREFETLGIQLFRHPEMVSNPNAAGLQIIAESLIKEGRN